MLSPPILLTIYVLPLIAKQNPFRETALQSLILMTQSRFSMPLPLDEWFFKIYHGIDDEFRKASIKNAAFIPDIVIIKKISYLSLAVGAWSADIFFDIR
jgi:hypothetical protein